MFIMRKNYKTKTVYTEHGFPLSMEIENYTVYEQVDGKLEFIAESSTTCTDKRDIKYWAKCHSQIYNCRIPKTAEE